MIQLKELFNDQLKPRVLISRGTRSQMDKGVDTFRVFECSHSYSLFTLATQTEQNLLLVITTRRKSRDQTERSLFYSHYKFLHFPDSTLLFDVQIKICRNL